MVNFIRKHAIEQIISKTEEIDCDIFFSKSIIDGNFKIIGVRKKAGKYQSTPIATTSIKTEIQPGVSWELLKEITIVDILRAIKNGDFRI